MPVRASIGYQPLSRATGKYLPPTTIIIIAQNNNNPKILRLLLLMPKALEFQWLIPYNKYSTYITNVKLIYPQANPKIKKL